MSGGGTPAPAGAYTVLGPDGSLDAVELAAARPNWLRPRRLR